MSGQHAGKWSIEKTKPALIRGLCFFREADSTDLSGRVVECCQFHEMRMSLSRWVHCTFIDCEFTGSFLRAAHFAHCRFIRCRFVGCTMDGAEFDAGCKYERCTVRGCDLTGASVVLPDPTQFCIEDPADPAALPPAGASFTQLKAAKFSGSPFYDRRIFPRYLVDEFPDSGNQATTGLGRRSRDGMEVAIKVFDKAFLGVDTVGRQVQHAREVDNLRAANNRYVPGLVEADPYGVPHFIVEERCPGRPLSDWIARGERFPALQRELFREAFSGLHCLQSAPLGCILHRDIKPSNLMVALPGSGRVILKYIDMGLSKIIVGDYAAGSMAVGTLLTMAPEVEDCKRDSKQSDLFSLAVTLAWAVSGRHPFGFTPGTPLTRAARHHAIAGEPWLAGIDAPLAGVLRRCLAYRPEDRFATPQDVLSTLAS